MNTQIEIPSSNGLIVGLFEGSQGMREVCKHSDAQRVVIRSSLRVFQDALYICEKCNLLDYSSGVLDAYDAHMCLSAGFNSMYSSIARVLAAELSKERVGPHSILVLDTKLKSSGINTDCTIFDLFEGDLGGRAITWVFKQCDDVLLSGDYPRKRDLIACEGTNLKKCRGIGLSLTALPHKLSILKAQHPGIECLLDCSSLNLRTSWSGPPWCNCVDLSEFSPIFGVSDIIDSLKKWGTFQDTCNDSLIRRLMTLAGPPAICDTLIKNVDLQHISSFSALARNFDGIRTSVLNDLKRSLPGLKYLTKSMCAFCLLIRDCTFESDHSYWFSECLMRLVKGGLLRIRLDSAHGRYFIEPFYPLLVEKISQCMGFSVEFLFEGTMSTTALRNSRHVYEQFILFEVLKLSSSDFWQKMNTLGLESLFTTIPDLKRVMVIDMKSRLWITTMNTNALYIRESDGYGFRELGFYAIYKGQLSPVVLVLPEDQGGIRRPQYTLSLEQQGSTSWVNISATIPAEEMDSADLQEPASDSSEPVFDHVFNLMRVKLPWWDVSKKYRDYNAYMTRKLERYNAAARMALRQHKATPLTYSTAATETNARTLGLSVGEFALFKKQSEIYRTKVGLPHIGSIQSVRLLVRHLVMWGVQLTEVIETRKFLKRRRIFWLAGRSIQPETLQESCLALGTRMAIMAILDAVQRAAVIA